MNADVQTADWQRVVQEQERAVSSSDFAIRHERVMAAEPARDAALHRRMAAVHRQSERRHQAIADLYCSKALRSALNAETSAGARPFSVMSEIAALAGARAAVLTMVDTQAFETLVVASDARARRAQDMEFILGEGPLRDVLAGRGPVAVDDLELNPHWQAYGPEIHALGFHGVAAVPLYLRGVIVGAMVLLDPERTVESGQRLTVEHLGNALVRVLSTDGSAIWGSSSSRTDLVQAAELIALHYGGTLDDAIAMIRTRAIAEQRRVDSVVRTMLEECASDIC
jgi:hypothetical protein